jgi:hypothetical protein
MAPEYRHAAGTRGWGFKYRLMEVEGESGFFADCLPF